MLEKIKNIQLKLPTWIYVISFVFFVYLFVQIYNFHAESSINVIVRGMYMLNLGIHEMSHIIFMFLPNILVALAGSIGEIAFAILLLFAIIKSKSYFASVFAGLWIMLAFNSVGRYIADARVQLLPLVGPGATVNHDWHFILNRLNLLQYDTFLGGLMRVIGNLIGVLALIFGLWLIYRKIIHKNQSRIFQT